tara:strand:- start:5503 stop:6450 length:948 start_codon:yes stop_codon:yes gene_type:complete
MVGRTDKHFRTLVRILSKNINLYTEMITCDAYLNTNRKTYKVKKSEHPITIQLAGTDPYKFAKCSEIAETNGYDEINLNIGCPSSKVLKGQFGAILMNYPEKVSQCVKEIKKSCSLPISIKTRLGLGYDKNLDRLRKLIDMTENSGCTNFIIHARNAILGKLSPKKNRTIPELRYQDVLFIKNIYPDLKIILNGGISTLDDIKCNIKHYDGIMIGRKIYDDPLFLLKLEKEFFHINKDIIIEDILFKYKMYMDNEIKRGENKYYMLRHLYNLYCKTSYSKKWKNYLSSIMQNKLNFENLLNFSATYNEKKISINS